MMVGGVAYFFFFFFFGLVEMSSTHGGRKETKKKKEEEEVIGLHGNRKRGSSACIRAKAGQNGGNGLVLVVTGIGNKDTLRGECHFVRRFTVRGERSTAVAR